VLHLRCVLCFLVVTACIALPAAAQQGGSGLSSADLQKLRKLGMPVIAPVPAPRGFRPHALLNAYDKTYKIVYSNTSGASITFAVDELSGGSADAGSHAAPAAPSKPRGFLPRVFGSTHAPSTGSADDTAATQGETEGHATSSLMADSRVIGPIRFAPAGPCLHGTADASKARVHGVRVQVTGCNVDSADLLISTYKRVQRL